MGGGGWVQTLEEQEVAVYFPHFLFEAPRASPPPLPPPLGQQIQVLALKHERSF